MDTHKLRIVVSNMKNANTREELDRIRTTVLQNLSRLPAAPSVPFEKRPPALATVRSARQRLPKSHNPKPRMAIEGHRARAWVHSAGPARSGHAQLEYESYVIYAHFGELLRTGTVSPVACRPGLGI